MQTLADIAGEHGVEKFHAEFEKLFYTLKRVHDNERLLTQKCRQLNVEIATNVSSVNAVLEMTQQEELASVQRHKVNPRRYIILYSHGRG